MEAEGGGGEEGKHGLGDDTPDGQVMVSLRESGRPGFKPEPMLNTNEKEKRERTNAAQLARTRREDSLDDDFFVSMPAHRPRESDVAERAPSAKKRGHSTDPKLHEPAQPPSSGVPARPRSTTPAAPASPPPRKQGVSPPLPAVSGTAVNHTPPPCLPAHTAVTPPCKLPGAAAFPAQQGLKRASPSPQPAPVPPPASKARAAKETPIQDTRAMTNRTSSTKLVGEPLRCSPSGTKREPQCPSSPRSVATAPPPPAKPILTRPAPGESLSPRSLSPILPSSARIPKPTPALSPQVVVEPGDRRETTERPSPPPVLSSKERFSFPSGSLPQDIPEHPKACHAKSPPRPSSPPRAAFSSASAGPVVLGYPSSF